MDRISLAFGLLLAGCFWTACGVEHASSHKSAELNTAYESTDYERGISPQDPMQSLPVESMPHATGSHENTVKQAHVGFGVANYRKKVAHARGLIVGYGGFIASEDERYSPHKVSNTVVARIPNPNFNELLDSIYNLADDPHYRKLQVLDVSAEVLRLEKQQKRNAQNKELLDKERKKARSVEGRQVYANKSNAAASAFDAAQLAKLQLDQRMKFSTVTLVIAQDFAATPQEEAPGFGSRWAAAFGGGLAALGDLLIGITFSWPWLLALAIGVMFLFRFLTKNKGRNRGLTTNHSIKNPIS